MDDVLQKAFNDQIALEQSSARAYRQLAVWADMHDYAGATAWLIAQSAEEQHHADLFIDHVLDRDGEVVLQALEAPPSEFTSLLEVFETALAQEQRVTAAIGDLYGLASSSGDYRSLPMLTRFLDEQVEEEASVRTIVGELRMVADSPSATLLVDRELPVRRGGDGGGGA